MIDSNIVIYASKPENGWLREVIAGLAPSVSVICRVEVLGTTAISDDEKSFAEAFFDAAHEVPVDGAVIQQAIALRQSRRMSLGDSLIAASALLQDGFLLTRNVKDFAWIPGLKVINPFENGKPH